MKNKHDFTDAGDWLLCDFHIHTTFSDGKLPLGEVVDLYGKAGVGVISITDHILDKYTTEKRLRDNEPLKVINEEKFGDYLKILWQESKRSWEKYGMILIPGAEITNDRNLYHIIVIDIKEYIDPTLSVEKIIEKAREQNAVVIVAHPDRKKEDKEHSSWYLWKNQEKYGDLFDAWEVANRDDLFNSVGVKKRNYIANSDFHESRHLYSWKTLMRTAKNIEAVKKAIRTNEEIAIYLMRSKDKKNQAPPYPTISRQERGEIHAKSKPR